MESIAPVIQNIAVIALPILFAVILHEVAHGWVAHALGDPTAKKAGRLTLNPIHHIDPFGTVIMPILLFFLSNGKLIFGYARPVPINPYNFKNPKRDMALSSLAGPGINILMAVGCAAVLRLAMPAAEKFLPERVWSWFAEPTELMFLYGVLINVVLAVLNMIPIPPLDGSRVVYWLLPEKQAMVYYRLERYGMLVLLALFAFGLLGRIISPIIEPILYLLLGEKIF